MVFENFRLYLNSFQFSKLKPLIFVSDNFLINFRICLKIIRFNLLLDFSHIKNELQFFIM